MTYECGNVTVDEHFVRVGLKSYAIDKINSIEVRPIRHPGKWGWIVLWIFAFFSLASGIASAASGGNGVVGFVLAPILGVAGYGSFQKRQARMSYELYLMTSSGEVQGAKTDDGEEMGQLRGAIERAMTGRA